MRVIMLGTVLGLRACDITALKLSDIDWLHGEIKIIQSKTANPVVLPLTQDVGEALMDYILYLFPSIKRPKNRVQNPLDSDFVLDFWLRFRRKLVLSHAPVHL